MAGTHPVEIDVKLADAVTRERDKPVSASQIWQWRVREQVIPAPPRLHPGRGSGSKTLDYPSADRKTAVAVAVAYADALDQGRTAAEAAITAYGATGAVRDEGLRRAWVADYTRRLDRSNQQAERGRLSRRGQQRIRQHASTLGLSAKQAAYVVAAVRELESGREPRPGALQRMLEATTGMGALPPGLVASIAADLQLDPEQPGELRDVMTQMMSLESLRRSAREASRKELDTCREQLAMMSALTAGALTLAGQMYETLEPGSTVNPEPYAVGFYTPGAIKTLHKEQLLSPGAEQPERANEDFPGLLGELIRGER
jgi:hypothetical protein